MKPDQTYAFTRPLRRPANRHFSSGPTSKRPGWSTSCLDQAFTGRSHRAADGVSKIQYCHDMMRELLGLPEDYRIGIVPASDTGAVEMAMWSMLGARGVDMLAWEAFGQTWVKDTVQQLGLDDIRVFEAEYGDIVDFSKLDDDRDVVLTWNGTASGVRVPHGDWINPDREGLIIADSTSAAFAMPMPIDRLDVITFSWQKSLGGEGAHGVIVLSPKAVERLESYTPPWPLPKIFQLTKNGKLQDAIFKGATINTPSMLCIEDAIDALEWAKSIGGREALFARVEANFNVIKSWVDGHDHVAFLAADPATVSPTSMTLKITAPWFTAASHLEQSRMAKSLVRLLEHEDVAYDIGAYRDAPPGLRIWGGPTVAPDDLDALTQWIDWGLKEIEHQETISPHKSHKANTSKEGQNHD